MKTDDPARLQIIEAMLKRHSVSPNIRQLKNQTGFHKATIKSSIDFLAKEGLLQGFGPRVDVRRFGLKLEAIELLQVALSEKELFKKYVDLVLQDPHIYRLSAVVGSGNWNILARHIYRDIESFHEGTQKKYYEQLPGIYKLIKDRMIFYTADPTYKSDSRTKSIISILKREKGLD